MMECSGKKRNKWKIERGVGQTVCRGPPCALDLQLFSSGVRAVAPDPAGLLLGLLQLLSLLVLVAGERKRPRARKIEVS
jgi:hypothetical protein